MTVESIANVVLASTSVCTLLLAVFVYLRGASTRRYAERAEDAAQLLQTMATLELDGMDVGLDQPAARALHETQLRELRQVIRVSARGFTEKAKHPGIPALLLGYGVFVGALFIYVGVRAAPSVSSVMSGVQWAAWLVVVALVAIGLGVAAGSSMALWRKWAARERQRAAGIKVTTVAADVRESFILIRAASRRHRRTRRDRRAARTELRRVA